MQWIKLKSKLYIDLLGIMVGVTRKDRVRNEDVRNKTNARDIIQEKQRNGGGQATLQGAMTTDGHIVLRNGPQEHIRDEEADQAGVGWTTSENSEPLHGCDKHRKDRGGMMMKRPNSFCSGATWAR